MNSWVKHAYLIFFYFAPEPSLDRLNYFEFLPSVFVKTCLEANFGAKNDMFLELGFPKAIGCNLASLQKLLFFFNYCQIWNTLWSLIIKHSPHISVFGLNCGSNAFTALKFCYDLIIEADLFYAIPKNLVAFYDMDSLLYWSNWCHSNQSHNVLFVMEIFENIILLLSKNFSVF